MDRQELEWVGAHAVEHEVLDLAFFELQVPQLASLQMRDVGLCRTDRNRIPTGFNSLNCNKISFILGIFIHELIAILDLKVISLTGILSITQHNLRALLVVVRRLDQNRVQTFLVEKGVVRNCVLVQKVIPHLMLLKHHVVLSHLQHEIVTGSQLVLRVHFYDQCALVLACRLVQKLLWHC